MGPKTIRGSISSSSQVALERSSSIPIDFLPSFLSPLLHLVVHPWSLTALQQQPQEEEQPSNRERGQGEARKGLGEGRPSTPSAAFRGKRNWTFSDFLLLLAVVALAASALPLDPQ